MKLYQKIREVVEASDMTIIDKAYIYTALNDIAAYVTSDDYARFVNGGMSGFNGLGLNDKQGALNFLSAAGGLAEYECYIGGSIRHLDCMFVFSNADILCECFKKHGLITDSIVDEAVHSLCNSCTGHIKTSSPDVWLKDLVLPIDDIMSLVKQEIVWRFNSKARKEVSVIEEQKLLDIDVDMFLGMFSDESRKTAFVVSLFRKMSDEQLRSVYNLYF